MTTHRRVHFPAGFLPAGTGVRAVCNCGFRGARRVDERRARDALLNKHGTSDNACGLCGQCFPGHQGWEDLLARHLELLTDSETGDQLLVCREESRACRDRAAQRQTQLDRAAADSLGIDLPRPALRVVEPTTIDRRGAS